MRTRLHTTAKWLLSTRWLLLLLSGPAAFAQQGKNGARTITAANTIVNAYTNLTARATAGSKTITVGASALNDNGEAPLAAGDLVMIIQMQGAIIDATNTAAYGSVTDYNGAGKYELLEVAAVPSATTITFTCGLSATYSAASKVQIVRIPRYTTLALNANTSISAPAWNGTTGGIVALDVAGNTTLATGAAIDVSALGFRGGAVDNNSDYTPATPNLDYRTVSSSFGAEKGEGIAGYQLDYDVLNGRYGRGAAANGGGGGNSHNASGGGGANVGTGTRTGAGIPDRGLANVYDAAWNLE